MFGVTECIFECSARDRKVDIDLCRKNNLLHYSKRSCIKPIEKIYFRIYLRFQRSCADSEFISQDIFGYFCADISFRLV